MLIYESLGFNYEWNSRRASMLDNVDVLCMYVAETMLGPKGTKTGNAGNLQLDTCYIHTQVPAHSVSASPITGRVGGFLGL